MNGLVSWISVCLILHVGPKREDWSQDRREGVGAERIGKNECDDDRQINGDGRMFIRWYNSNM